MQKRLLKDNEIQIIESGFYKLPGKLNLCLEEDMFTDIEISADTIQSSKGIYLLKTKPIW